MLVPSEFRVGHERRTPQPAAGILRKIYKLARKRRAPVEAVDEDRGTDSEQRSNCAVEIPLHNPLVPGSCPDGSIPAECG